MTCSGIQPAGKKKKKKRVRDASKTLPISPLLHLLVSGDSAQISGSPSEKEAGVCQSDCPCPIQSRFHS